MQIILREFLKSRRLHVSGTYMMYYCMVDYVECQSCFAVGIGEGVVLPSMSALVATQVHPEAKARALGTVFTGFHCGNLVGLALSPAIIAAQGWPALFLTFGCLGIPLLVLWWVFTPRSVTSNMASAKSAQEQANSNSISSDTVAYSKSSPSLASFLRHKPVQAIIIANFVNHWGYFVYLSWIPSYFVRAFALDLKASSFLSFVPWVAMAAGSSFAGILADMLVQRMPVRRLFVRR
jgi:predicted MFS family arabinose efflux permease